MVGSAPATEETRRAQILQYYNIIHRHTPYNATITLGTLTPTSHWHSRYFTNTKDGRAQLVQAAATTDEPCYIRITPRAKRPHRGRGLAKDALGTSVLWVDVDTRTPERTAEVLQQLQGLDKPPTMVVDSGRGLHAYWLLDCFVTDHDAIVQRNYHLVTTLKASAADGCYDLARVLRVPGTYHTKTEPPKLAEVVYVDAGREYSIDDFDAAPPPTKAVAPFWDTLAIPEDFLDTLAQRDPKLTQRIRTEAGARAAGATEVADGSINRS